MLPEIKWIGSKLKLGITLIDLFSPINSSSSGSILRICCTLFNATKLRETTFKGKTLLDFEIYKQTFDIYFSRPKSGLTVSKLKDYSFRTAANVYISKCF